jgi:hypothetical protein
MPLTYSIATGIGLGFITYALAKLIAGKLADAKPAVLVLAHASFGVYRARRPAMEFPSPPKVHLSCSDQETVSGSTALSRMPTALVVLFGLFGLGFGVGYAVRKRRSRMRRRSYYHDD